MRELELNSFRDALDIIKEKGGLKSFKTDIFEMVPDAAERKIQVAFSKIYSFRMVSAKSVRDILKDIDECFKNGHFISDLHLRLEEGHNEKIKRKDELICGFKRQIEELTKYKDYYDLSYKMKNATESGE